MKVPDTADQQSQGSNFNYRFMYECESWTIKKAERWRIGAFELWCWRRLFESPLDCKRSNQSILKEINPEYSLKGLVLKLKLQYFGHLMRRTDSLENTMMLGKIEGRRRRGQQRMMRQLDGITNSMDMSLSKLWVLVMDRDLACCSPWGQKESDTNERLNWSDIYFPASLHTFRAQPNSKGLDREWQLYVN